MKKRLFKLILCAAMTTLMLSLSGCGGDDESESKNDNELKSTTAATDENTKDDTDSDKTYSSIEDFANSTEFQSQLSTITSSLSENGMELKVTGEGNKLIYTYKYTSIVTEEGDGMAEALESGMAAQASTFESLAKSLENEIDVKNPIVVVKYLDAEDTVIYSQEYTAE